MTESEILKKLADCDLALMRLAKSLEELPERAQIMECRAKRKELKGKQDQVFDLTDDVNAKLEKLQLEETRLIEKLKEAQDTLDHTSDFRVTNSVTKDMEGMVKRQATLAQEQDDLLERQIKIDNLAAQLHEMLHQLDHKEEHLSADFKKKGGEIVEKQNEKKAARAELIEQLNPQLASRYEKLRAEKGGIGVGFLEGSVCSACHAELQPGQLAKVKAAEGITECPSCHRIFVVE